MIPVETDAAGFVLHAEGFDHGRQGFGNAGEHRFVSVLFLEFEFLPVLFHFAGIGHFDLAKNVGMAVDELCYKLFADVLDVELALFSTNFGVKDNVQEDVTQLFTNFGRVFFQQCFA